MRKCQLRKLWHFLFYICSIIIAFDCMKIFSLLVFFGVLFASANTAQAQTICNFQPADSKINDNRQMIQVGDGLKKDIELKLVKDEIQAYCTFENSEKINIMFCEDSALNAVDEVIVSGKELFFVKLLGKGIKNKEKHNEKYFCEVELRIAENAKPGKRTVKLRRPGMFHKEENIYTINLIPNIRITGYADNLINIAKRSEPYLFYLEGQGLEQITGIKKDVATKGKGIVESIKIDSRTTGRINISMVFNTEGQITLNELINDFLQLPQGTAILNLKEGDTEQQPVVIKVGKP